MMQPSKPAARGLIREPLRNIPSASSFLPRIYSSAVAWCQLGEPLAEAIVVFPRKDYPDYHEFVDQIVGARRKSLRIAEKCDGGTSQMAAVASGKGIAISASIVVNAAGARLRFIPLTPAPPPAEVALASCATAPTPPTSRFPETAHTVPVTGKNCGNRIRE
jgi:DNA-binding transcriptional LysR family regulator